MNWKDKSLPEILFGWKTKNGHVNDGIKSLPDIIKGGAINKATEIFTGVYGLTYWIVNFYCTYQLCCYVTSSDGKRINKIISAIIMYIFLTIIASVIL